MSQDKVVEALVGVGLSVNEARAYVALLGAGLSAFARGALTTLELRVGLAGVAVLGMLVYVCAVLAPRLAYVQARPNSLLLSTPLFRLNISLNLKWKFPQR